MSNKHQQVAIVGAGPVGSLWALYLAKHGYTVELYERRPDMRVERVDGGRSINLALSDRGLKALHAVGLDEQIRKMAIPMHGRMVHAEDGTTNFQPYGLEGQYINSISRGGLNELLMTEAENQGKVGIQFNQRCVDADLSTGELLMEDTHNHYQTRIKPDMVFGADGAFSAIRQAFDKQDGFQSSQEVLAHGYKELTIPAAPFGGFQLEKNALHIWPRKSFMLIALPNLDGSFTCTLFLAMEGEISFAALQDPESVILFFEKYFKDVLDLMPDFPSEFFNNPTSTLVTIRSYPWSHKGNFLLLGDAAHAVVPFYGQGMNAGFEDCTVLSGLLDKIGDGNWRQIVEAFQTIRKPDADAIAELAVRNFKEMRDSVIDERFLLRKKIEKAMQLSHPEQFLPLYSMVTFSHMPYSQALNTGDRHNQHFANIDLAELKRIADSLDTEATQTLLHQWVQQLS